MNFTNLIQNERVFQVVVFWAIFPIVLLLLAAPVCIMIFYGGWSKWILLAVVAMTAMVTLGGIGVFDHDDMVWT